MCSTHPPSHALLLLHVSSPILTYISIASYLAIAHQDLTEFGVYSSKEVEELDKQKRLYQAISKRQVHVNNLLCVLYEVCEVK